MVGCCAVGCSNRSEKGFLMKAFPTDQGQREIWAVNVKRESWTPSSGSRLCEIHFAPEMWEKTREDGKRVLKGFAIPTIFPFSEAKSKRKIPIKRKNPIILRTPAKKPTIKRIEPIPGIPTIKTEHEKPSSISSIRPVLPTEEKIQLVKKLCPIPTTEKIPTIEPQPCLPTVKTKNEELSSTSIPVRPVLPPEEKIQLVKKLCSTPTTEQIPTIKPQPCLPTIKTENEDSLSSSSCSSSPIQSVSPIPENLQLNQKLRRYETVYKKLLHKTIKYKNQIRCLKRKIKHSSTGNTRNETLLQKIFNDDQILALKRKSTRFMKWSDKTMTNALKLKFACGNIGYEEILKQNFPLPSLRTISRRLQYINFDSGILQEVFSFLKIKVETFTDDHQKDCAIILNLNETDNVMVPENQKKTIYALVVTIRGISTRWQQIVAYFFIDSINDIVLQTILFEIIKKAEQFGLNVLSITSDMNKINESLWKITAGKYLQTQNFIENPNTQKKIYIFADIPNLFKNIKKMFMTNKIIEIPEKIKIKNNLPTNIISANHIQELFDFEKVYKLRLVPKPNEEDLVPENFQKMKISSKVVTHDVSSGLKYLSDELNKPEFKTTAWFLDTLEKWFKLMTSRNPMFALSKKNDYENSISFLKDTIELISTIKIGENEIWEPCQTGLLISTESILKVQELLLKNKDYSFVLTSRFTQVSLENLSNVTKPKPNAQQFKDNLKLITVSQYLKDVSKFSYGTDE